jgi:hypothetical protein
MTFGVFLISYVLRFARLYCQFRKKDRAEFLASVVIGGLFRRRHHAESLGTVGSLVRHGIDSGLRDLNHQSRLRRIGQSHRHWHRIDCSHLHFDGCSCLHLHWNGYSCS